jgi:hypothetical protein
MKFQSSVLILVVLFTSTAGNLVDNMSHVNPNDPHVLCIAKFAVKEHNSQVYKGKLKFEKVINGVSQTDRDVIDYHLTPANNGSSSNNYVHHKYITTRLFWT